jgi:hypothetical protein
MILSIYKGILIKKENRWFVFNKPGVDKMGWPMFISKESGNIELEIFPTDNHPIEWLEKHLDQEVDYNLAKKFLAKETLWYAKITEIDKQETWEGIIKKYGEPTGVPEAALEFWDWLEENYHPPKRK